MSEDSERIAKYLARCGIASRREAEKRITEGKITLIEAGKALEEKILHPSFRVKPGDRVFYEGEEIRPPDRTRLWRYHKPAGLITTHSDPEGRKTVFDSLPSHLGRVVSVGRLDLNSEGLLLLTNQGETAHLLEMPSAGWKRTYRVRVFGAVSKKDLADLAKGRVIDGVRYGPVEATLDSSKGDNSWLTVSLTEGKNREIRKIMESLGLQVNRLIRTAYGPFELGDLKAGRTEEVPGSVLRHSLPAGAYRNQEMESRRNRKKSGTAEK